MKTGKVYQKPRREALKEWCKNEEALVCDGENVNKTLNCNESIQVSSFWLKGENEEENEG